MSAQRPRSERPARLAPNTRAHLEAIAGGQNPDAGIVQVTYASNIEAADVDWLWDGRVPLGSYTPLVGRQGLGKSTFAIELAARVSRGHLPGAAFGTPATTLFVTAEDTPATTLVPRLIASKGDPARVAFVDVKRAGTTAALKLPEQTEQLAETARTTGARLIVLDPVKSFIGDINPDKESEVRRVLDPLNRLATRLQLAVVPILHFNKGDAQAILDRVAGAGAWTQAARSVLFFGLDPDDPAAESGAQRVLAHAKCNVGPLAPSAAVRLQRHELEGGIVATRARVMGQASVSARETVETDEQRSDRREAMNFLEVELAGGPYNVQALIKKARAVGIEPKTLRRAKAELGVKSRVAPQVPGGWEWELPR